MARQIASKMLSARSLTVISVLGLCLNASTSFAEGGKFTSTDYEGIGTEVTAGDSNKAGASASGGAVIGGAVLSSQRNCGYYSWCPLAYAGGMAHYNTIGFTGEGRFTTGLKLNAQLFIGGTTLGDHEYGCSFYGGLGGSAEGQVVTMRPGDSKVVAEVGPETGLLCQTSTGVIFMISPTVGVGYAGSFDITNPEGSDTQSGSNTHVITAGGRARLGIQDKAIVTAEGLTTPDVTTAPSAGAMTSGRFDVMVLMQDGWRVGGYVEGLHIKDSASTYNAAEGGATLIKNF